MIASHAVDCSERSNVLDTNFKHIDVFWFGRERTFVFFVIFGENSNPKDKNQSCSFQVFQNHLHVNDICKLFFGKQY